MILQGCFCSVDHFMLCMKVEEVKEDMVPSNIYDCEMVCVSFFSF